MAWGKRGLKLLLMINSEQAQVVVRKDAFIYFL